MEPAVFSRAPLQVLTWFPFFFFSSSSFYTVSSGTSLASAFRTLKLVFRGNFIFSCDTEQRTHMTMECNQTLTVDVCGKVREGNGKPLQYSCLENPMNSMKRQKIGHWKVNSPGWWVSSMLLEISGELTPERLKRQSQSKNNTQLWMWLVMEVKSNALKSNIA